MTLSRTSYLAGGGLIFLMIGLFGATFHLNRGNYSASISTVESSFSRTLEQEARALRNRVAEQETQAFALRGTERELEQELFFITADRVVPACVAHLFETIPEAEARNAFARGIELLPDDAALPFFREAAKGAVTTEDDAYRKISALFNILGIKPNIQTTCGILYLLNNENSLLDASRVHFFREMLEELVPDLAKIEPEASALTQTAKEIDTELTRRKGAYRDSHHGMTLSVREDGLATLYVFHFTIADPVELTLKPPEGPSVEIVKGVHAIIPLQVVIQAKADIRKQYRTGNMILALMLFLGTALAIGMLAAVRRQRQLDATRARFIATVSHELRTPLSLIRLHAETLHHGRIPPEKVSEYHQTILTESERLSGIVNNVLDFSRMERNKLQIHLEPTDLSALCERIADSFRFRLEQDGFALEKQIQPGIVASVDPLAFSQVVFNLVDNAIKYSDEEKIIRIELESSKGWNILRVADHGIGIPDQLKKKIFDDFVRSDDRKVTARRGSGIGLSVARRLAEEMGASIDVMDNKPTGTIFTVSFKDTDETIGG
ncbi:MAG: hypothetical protein DRP64_08740 [Verrucomicrobia bacterium]|nr:MAG: hypothetical protein DRP64_08740 [Verrucomicrobiota bacterium]